MKLTKLAEYGYEEAALGFSLSFNSTLERAKEILPKYAFGVPGENKFLRAIHVWLDITAPRFFLTELDTYKIATVRLSESTMHTITRRALTKDDFEDGIINNFALCAFNKLTRMYRDNLYDEYGQLRRITPEEKKSLFKQIKCSLQEGFLQRIVFECNYATLQNIYNQRKNHRLEQWQYFCDEILKQVAHPEFIVKDYVK